MIKHAIIRKYNGLLFKRRYLCNQACSINEDKRAKNLEEITCKNCLKILKTYVEFIKEVENEN